MAEAADVMPPSLLQAVSCCICPQRSKHIKSSLECPTDMDRSYFGLFGAPGVGGLMGHEWRKLWSCRWLGCLLAVQTFTFRQRPSVSHTLTGDSLMQRRDFNFLGFYGLVYMKARKLTSWRSLKISLNQGSYCRDFCSGCGDFSCEALPRP